MSKWMVVVSMLTVTTWSMAADEVKQPPRGGDRHPMFEAMDANKDGKVTADEFTAQGAEFAKKRFAAIDANSDGKITEDEFKAANDKHPGASDKRPAFKDLDKNGDGAITQDEMSAGGKDRMMERFKKLDANGDGSLTKEEVEAARKNFAPRGGGRHGDQGGEKAKGGAAEGAK